MQQEYKTYINASLFPRKHFISEMALNFKINGMQGTSDILKYKAMLLWAGY